MRIADHVKALQVLSASVAAQAVRGRGERYLAPSGDTTGATDAAALASLAASNTRLVLGRGDFYLPAAGVAFNGLTNFTLDCGGATIKAAANASTELQSFGATFVRMTSCVRSRITAGTFDANGKTGNPVGMAGCVDSEIAGNTLTGADGLGHIVGGGNTRCRVRGNTIHDGLGTSRGIWFGNCTEEEINTDCAISGNTVRDVGATAIVNISVGGVVSENGCHNSDGSGIVLSGANGYACADVTVTGNNVSGHLFHGIQVDVVYSTDADLVRGCTISGNTATSNTMTGIYMPGSMHCAVTGNTCTDNVTAGIQADDRAGYLTINGNTCTDTRTGEERTQEVGIRVGKQAASDGGISIVGNTCSNHTQRGINVFTASGNTLTDLAIVGNTCNDNDVHGIFLAEESAGDMERVTLSGNCAYGNGTVDIRASLVDVSMIGNRYGTQQDVQYLNFTNGDTTPSVGGRKLWRASNGSATTITDFDDAVDGHEIVILAANANTTIEQGTIQLKGAQNAKMPADGCMTLVKQGTVWREVSRSF